MQISKAQLNCTLFIDLTFLGQIIVLIFDVQNCLKLFLRKFIDKLQGSINNIAYESTPSNEYQTSSNLITLAPGAAPAAVESIANDQVMKAKFTNLREHIISQAKATADDVKRNHDEELKDFKDDIDRQLKVLGVLKVEGLHNIVWINSD